MNQRERELVERAKRHHRINWEDFREVEALLAIIQRQEAWIKKAKDFLEKNRKGFECTCREDEFADCPKDECERLLAQLEPQATTQ